MTKDCASERRESDENALATRTTSVCGRRADAFTPCTPAVSNTSGDNLKSGTPLAYPLRPNL